MIGWSAARSAWVEMRIDNTPGTPQQYAMGSLQDGMLYLSENNAVRIVDGTTLLAPDAVETNNPDPAWTALITVGDGTVSFIEADRDITLARSGQAE